MRAVSRDLCGGFDKSRKKLREKKGPYFEKYVKNMIGKAIKGATDFKCNIMVKSPPSKEVVWEIDVGFVFQGILFLVDAKHWYKQIKYFLAEGTSISSRLSDLESLLDAEDRKLKRYQRIVAKIWNEHLVAGAICLMCTEDVEFVGSFDRKWWLQTGEYPRICLVGELIRYLQSENLASLYDHPEFVRFQRS